MNANRHICLKKNILTQYQVFDVKSSFQNIIERWKSTGLLFEVSRFLTDFNEISIYSTQRYINNQIVISDFQCKIHNF